MKEPLEDHMIALVVPVHNWGLGRNLVLGVGVVATLVLELVVEEVLPVEQFWSSSFRDPSEVGPTKAH